MFTVALGARSMDRTLDRQLSSFLDSSSSEGGDSFDPLSLPHLFYSDPDFPALKTGAVEAGFTEGVEVWENQGTGATDLVQLNGPQQPSRLPLIDGEGYLFTPGVSGNFAALLGYEPPNVGLFRVEYRGFPSDWSASTGDEAFASVYDSTLNSRCWYLGRNDRRLLFYASDLGGYDPSGLKSSTVDVDLDVNASAVEYDRDVNEIRFYTSNDGGDNWTQLGASVPHSLNYRSASLVPLVIDGINNGTTFNVTPSAACKSLRLIQDGLIVRHVDFTKQQHDSRLFAAETGEIVVVSQAGENDATVIHCATNRGQRLNESALEASFDSTEGDLTWMCCYRPNGPGGIESSNVFNANAAGGNPVGARGLRYSGAFMPNLDGVVRWDRVNVFIPGGMSPGVHIVTIRVVGTSAFVRLDEDPEIEVVGLGQTPLFGEFSIFRREVPANVNRDFSGDISHKAVLPSTVEESDLLRLREYWRAQINAFDISELDPPIPPI